MKSQRRNLPGAVLIILVLLLITSLVMVAAPPAEVPSYSLGWNVTAGGGAQTGADNYTLSASNGQPLTGTSVGGAYDLTSGFWTGGTPGYSIFLPVLAKP